jgi:hypothetical protein
MGKSDPIIWISPPSYATRLDLITDLESENYGKTTTSGTSLASKWRYWRLTLRENESSRLQQIFASIEFKPLVQSTTLTGG